MTGGSPCLPPVFIHTEIVEHFGMKPITNVFTSGFLAQTYNLQSLLTCENKSFSFEWASTDVWGVFKHCLENSSCHLWVDFFIAHFQGFAYICILCRDSFCLYKSSQRSQRGDQQRGLVCLINNNTRVCHNDTEVSSNVHWAGQGFLCPQEAEKRNPIICARASTSCTRSDLQHGCLLANHLLLLQGLHLKQLAVQLRAWSWPVLVAHSLSRLLLLAQWLAASSPYWGIFEWCGYPLWLRMWLFALGCRCRLLPLCDLFELCFLSHYISH